MLLKKGGLTCSVSPSSFLLSGDPGGSRGGRCITPHPWIGFCPWGQLCPRGHHVPTTGEEAVLFLLLLIPIFLPPSLSNYILI